MGAIRKLFLMFILLIFTGGCTPTYRILTVDYQYDYKLTQSHKYDIVNIKNGKTLIVYDYPFFLPGSYVLVKKDTTIDGKIKLFYDF